MKNLISAAFVIALLAISNHAEEMHSVTLVASPQASNHLQQQAAQHQVQGQGPTLSQNQIQIQGQHANPGHPGQSRPHPHPHPNPHHPKHPHHHHKGPHPMSVGRQGRAGISDLFRGVFGGRSHPHPHPHPHPHQHQHQQRGPAPVGYPQHAALPPKNYGDKVVASSSSNSVLHHPFPQNFNGGGGGGMEIRNVRNAQHSQQSIMGHRQPHSIQFGHGHTMPGYGPQGPRHPMATGGMPMSMIMPNSLKPPSPPQFQQTTQNIMEGVSGIEEGPPPPQTPQVSHSYSEPQLTHHHYHSYQNPTEGSIQGQGSTQNVHSSNFMQESTPPGPSFNDFQQQLQGPQGGFDLGPSDPSSADSFKLSTSTTGPGQRGTGSSNSNVQKIPNPHKWNGPTSFTEFGNFGAGAPSSSDFGNMEIQSQQQQAKSSSQSSTSPRSPTVSVSMSTSTSSSSASPGDFSFGGPEDPEPTEQYEELTRLVRREPYIHSDGDGHYYNVNPQGQGSSQSNEGGYFPSGGGGPSNFGYSGDNNGPSDQGQGPIMKSHPLRSTVTNLGDSPFGQEESSNQENFMFRPVSSSYRVPVPGASGPGDSAVYGKPMMVSASSSNPNSYRKPGGKIQTYHHGGHPMNFGGSGGANTASSSVVPMRAYKPRQHGRPSQPDPLPFKSSPRLPANFDDYNSQAQQMQHSLPMSTFQSQRLKPQVKKQTKSPAEETSGMMESNPKLKFKSSSPIRSMKSASYQRPSVVEPDSAASSRHHGHHGHGHGHSHGHGHGHGHSHGHGHGHGHNSLEHGQHGLESSNGDRILYHVSGHQGPNSYRFGYDTGKGYNRQFRHEEKDGKGFVTGRYGFYDKHGKLNVVKYEAHPTKGYKAERDNGYHGHQSHHIAPGKGHHGKGH